MSFVFGIGIGIQNNQGYWLEVFYQQLVMIFDNVLMEVVQNVLDYKGGNQVISVIVEQFSQFVYVLCQIGEVEQVKFVEIVVFSKCFVVVIIFEIDDMVFSIFEVYFKLYLIFYCMVKFYFLKFDGIFGLLLNLVWISEGVIDLGELLDCQFQVCVEGCILEIKFVDKFLQMIDYVVFKGVCIVDIVCVCLGVYVGEGIIVMYEGFINFNVGIEGISMIEGCIFVGVMIGKGFDLGGGCFIMGIFFGGGNIIIVVGENCLIGVNVGIGILLGDCCKVEVGLYIIVGIKVVLLDDNNELV